MKLKGSALAINAQVHCLMCVCQWKNWDTNALSMKVRAVNVLLDKFLK
jgi:hypothetical protein